MIRSIKSGFTIIELMLSMTFVAVLLLVIATTVISMGQTYSKGMTMKDVNQASRDISDDLRRSASQAEMFLANPDRSPTDDFVVTKEGPTTVTGRICMGNYTYIWNTAKALEEYEVNKTGNVAKALSYYPATTEAGARKPVQFVRVPDTGKNYCLKNTGTGALISKDISVGDVTQSNEVIKPGDFTMGVQNVAVSTSDAVYDAITGQKLYNFSYTIGIGKTSAMNSDQTACLPPDNPESDINACNVQQFNVIIKIGNSSS